VPEEALPGDTRHTDPRRKRGVLPRERVISGKEGSTIAESFFDCTNGFPGTASRMRTRGVPAK
jgi:hypothetical protein